MTKVQKIIIAIGLIIDFVYSIRLGLTESCIKAASAAPYSFLISSWIVRPTFLALILAVPILILDWIWVTRTHNGEYLFKSIVRKEAILALAFFLLGIAYTYYVSSFLYGNYLRNNPDYPCYENNQTNIKPNNQSFPYLDLPVEYFSNKDVKSSSAGKGTGDKITDYTEVFLKNNKTVYQSYPTTTVTINNYSGEIKPLKTKTSNQVKQEISKIVDYGQSRAEESYQKYGTLAVNYLPSDYIATLDKFDVDGDGKPETIVTYNFVDSADGGSYRSDIIKDSNIIFSVQEDNSSIIPADTNNGFYVEWGSVYGNTYTGRCCSEGFMRTRFVFKDGKFIPIYEQEIRYLKIGKK